MDVYSSNYKLSKTHKDKPKPTQAHEELSNLVVGLSGQEQAIKCTFNAYFQIKFKIMPGNKVKLLVVNEE